MNNPKTQSAALDKNHDTKAYKTIYRKLKRVSNMEHLPPPQRKKRRGTQMQAKVNQSLCLITYPRCYS